MNVEILKSSVWERCLGHLWEGRGPDLYSMISEPTDGVRRVNQQQQGYY